MSSVPPVQDLSGYPPIIEKNVTNPNITSPETNSPAGMFLAYFSLLAMALLPIYIGAFKSIRSQKKQREEAKRSGEKVEIMSHTDAAMFPVIASVALFVLYLVFQVFSKEYVNKLLSAYFVVIGVLALTHCISPIISGMLFPIVQFFISCIPIPFVKNYLQTELQPLSYNLVLASGTTSILDEALSHGNDKDTSSIASGSTQSTDKESSKQTDDSMEVRRRKGSKSQNSEDNENEDKSEMGQQEDEIDAHKGTFMKKIQLAFDVTFNTHDVVAFGVACLVGIAYIIKKHWITNNLFGVAFAINGIEMLHLNNILTGCILLGGLFVYDVFWVFGTDVMVTVAKSFDAPIKLIFPQDLLTKGWGAQNMAMLGLGDIVIPGIFIALILRYDMSLKRKYNIYFWTTYMAYVGALLSTIGVMHFFRHAQPALLYIVPACVLCPTALALLRGDIETMFDYADHPDVEDAFTMIEKKDGSANKKAEKKSVEDLIKEEVAGSPSRLTRSKKQL